jgi:hypothetical protein
MNFTVKYNKNCFTDSEILLLTKQNETKRNFAIFVVSRNMRNFAKQFFVSLCFVFCETKKVCEMETLAGISAGFFCYPALRSIAWDHDPAVCRIARDHGSGLCCIAPDQIAQRLISWSNFGPMLN